jgi:hypothetical protein
MNGESKLVVEIKNHDPVELLDLTQSLVAFAQEFQSFANFQLEGPYKTETRLFIKNISTGSIITELVPNAAGLLPLIGTFNTVIEFGTYLRNSVSWLLNPYRQHEPITSVTRNSLRNIASIVQPVAKDSASQLIVKAETVNIANVVLNMNSQEARALQAEAFYQLQSMSAPVTGLHEKVVMYWFQARNDPASKFGDKAIIESISPNPVRVIFASGRIKHDMLKIDENVFKHAYIVDVEVETIENRPVLYKIVNVHDLLERD